MLIISGGQSNNGTYEQGPCAPLSTLGWNVRAWNSRSLLPAESDTIKDYGTAWVTPSNGRRPYNESEGNCSAAWLCYSAARSLGRPVFHIQSSRGGHKIETWWSNGVGPSLRRLNLIRDRATDDKAQIFDWQGNEADCTQGTDFATYKAAHHAVVANQRARGALAADALILLTGLHPSHPEGDVAAFNTMLQGLSAEYDVRPSRSVFVPVVGDLTPGTVHWTAQTGKNMGAVKWAAAAARLAAV